MPKITTYRYRVKPKRRHTFSFPVDMLRYDQAWPLTETDSARLNRAVRGTPTESVNLMSHSDPEVERWASFGWLVEDIRKETR